MPFAVELSVAIAAVRRAAEVCSNVQRAIPAAMEKQDKSPVTIADFASQAVICRALGGAFSNDQIIGEEDSAELRLPENKPSLDGVESELSRIGVNGSPDEICRWIDRGGAKSFGPRFWTLDPIDGTKGFLRGEQYAVSLALIVDGQIEVAILGCPNLPLVPNGDPASGSLFIAVRGQGASVLPCFVGSGGFGSAFNVADLDPLAYRASRDRRKDSRRRYRESRKRYRGSDLGKTRRRLSHRRFPY